MGSRQPRVRVLAVDDHPPVLESIRTILERGREFQLVGVASDGREAIDRAHHLNPDIIIMDVRMPRCDGFAASQEIRRFNSKARILFYSGFSDIVDKVQAAGGNGFVGKGAPTLILTLAMQLVLAGRVFLDAMGWDTLREQLALGPDTGHIELNAEETAVCELLKKGLTNKEIAAQLGKKTRRIDKVRANVMERTAAKSAAGLGVILAANRFKRAASLYGIGSRDAASASH